MSIELIMLALSTALGLAQIALSATFKSRQTGGDWALGPRDEARVLTGHAGRLERALQNFLETFPLFAAAVLVAHLAGVHNWMTACGVQLYFWGRLLFVPLYAFGVAPWRTIAWSVATFGIALILLALVL